LSSQLITCLGNKRRLLPYIKEGVEDTKIRIDTLEVVTQDRPIKGEFTSQLQHYAYKPQKMQTGDGRFMYDMPIDTTRVGSSNASRPPLISFDVYRVATSPTGANDQQHKSGKFYFDHQCGIPLSSKTHREQWEKRNISGN